jgi:hypothetical protein
MKVEMVSLRRDPTFRGVGRDRRDGMREVPIKRKTDEG